MVVEIVAYKFDKLFSRDTSGTGPHST